MGFISFLLTQLLAAYTLLVEPFVRTNFYRNFKRQLKANPSILLLFYRTQVLWEWSWVVVLAVILIPIPDPLTWVGLTLPSMLGWIIVAALAFGVFLSTLLLRRSPRALASMQQSLQASSVWLPSTPAERSWFAAMAITAGICQELLYRGFLLRYLSVYFTGLGWLLSSVISGVVYGFGHAYQGRRNILQTMLTGFSFAILYFLGGNLFSAVTSTQPVVLVGTVIPPIIMHALLDLRPLFLWPSGFKAKKG
jgi:membrane protease YdiL (CAAX protease family)